MAATSVLASGPVKLNDPLPSGASGMQRAWMSPDSQTVVYVGDLNTAGAYEIYSTELPVAGFDSAPLLELLR